MLKLNSNQLKFIAVISMTIDHIGYVLYPDAYILRVIGRLAFPIYAYFIAQGIRNTKNEFKYLLRMSVFAVITQIAFYLFKVDFINVLFTFSLAIIGLMAVRREQYWIAPLVLVIAYYLNSDYSYLGILTVYIFYFFENKKLLRLLLLTVAIAFFILEANLNFNMNIVYQLYIYREYNWDLIALVLIEFYALLSLLLIDMYDHKKIEYKDIKEKLVNQYFFYIYYPLHLVILKILEGVI